MRKRIVLVLAMVVLAGLAVLGWQKFKPATPSVPTTPTTSYSEPVVTPAPVDQTPVVPPQVGLIVNAPKKNNVVTSPLTISGYVNGDMWNGYEGQVGSVRLLDNAGHVLAQGPLTATTEWTTTTVYFATTLQFTSPTTKTGSLIFRNENASGMPERERQFILPVKF